MRLLQYAARRPGSLDDATAGRRDGAAQAGRVYFGRDRAPRAQKNKLKPWLKEEWCIPTVSREFVWHMEDVLDLYAEAEDALRPRVCFDECPYQLLSETRRSVPVKPRRAARYDYEYRREGTCNLFVFVQPHTGWRSVKVTERRTKQDFAQCMKDLVDVHFPEAEVVRVVLDQLNTHTPAALYQAFAPEEARRIP